jgi:tRNA uridine 5-carbamoylmethylation protein Kti12
MAPTVQEIIQAAWQLTEEDRRRLVQALTASQADSGRHITELRGLGKEIWHGRDAQQYVDQERDSWAG